MESKLRRISWLIYSKPIIDASLHQVESIQKEYDSVKSGYLPKLDVSANYSTTNKETASVADKSYSASASLNYVLYDGGKKNTMYMTALKQILKVLKNRMKR